MACHLRNSGAPPGSDIRGIESGTRVVRSRTSFGAGLERSLGGKTLPSLVDTAGSFVEGFLARVNTRLDTVRHLSRRCTVSIPAHCGRITYPRLQGMTTPRTPTPAVDRHRTNVPLTPPAVTARLGPPPPKTGPSRSADRFRPRDTKAAASGSRGNLKRGRTGNVCAAPRKRFPQQSVGDCVGGREPTDFVPARSKLEGDAGRPRPVLDTGFGERCSSHRDRRDLGAA